MRSYSKQQHAAFAAALKALIKLSLVQQRDALQPRDFDTVRLCGPRQIGHTTAMVSLGTRMFSNPLFLFPNQESCRVAEKRFPIGMLASTYGSLKSIQALRGRNCDAVFVDQASLRLTRETLEALQHVCDGFRTQQYLRGRTFCLVLVG